MVCFEQIPPFNPTGTLSMLYLGIDQHKVQLTKKFCDWLKQLKLDSTVDRLEIDLHLKMAQITSRGKLNQAITITAIRTNGTP